MTLEQGAKYFTRSVPVEVTRNVSLIERVGKARSDLLIDLATGGLTKLLRSVVERNEVTPRSTFE
jgi:hypothetical protein